MKHLKSNWMSNLKTQNEALADLILGILIFGILVVFVGLFVAPDKAAFVLGAVLGTATSVIRAVHMAVTLDRQLDYGEKDARAYAARNYGIRYLIMIAVLLVSTRLGVSGMAGAVIGCDSESSDSQVYLYQNFWQRKVKLWAMKSTLWYMDMFL